MRDVDLGVLPGFAPNSEIKTLPDYQKGLELGAHAQEPPSDLNSVTRLRLPRGEEFEFGKFLTEASYRYRRTISEDLIPEKVAFRDGYLEGLSAFLEQHSIPSRDIFYTTPDILTSRNGFTGFVRGLRRESPAIARDYSQRRSSDKLIYEKGTESEWKFRARFERSQMLAGYRLGLIAGLARDTGVKLQGFYVPTDNVSYEAFMAGLRAEPRQVPVEKDPNYDKFNLRENPYAVFETVDNIAYDAGLRIWLQSQGLGEIQSWQIRHPAALRAFKAALGGETLSEYELPKPHAITDNPLPRQKDFTNLIEKIDKFDQRPLSPYEISGIEGKQGYRLGKTIRARRQLSTSSA